MAAIVALIDVETPYRDEFQALADRDGLMVVTPHLESLSPCSDSGPQLCVLGAKENEAEVCALRIREARERLGRAPIIVLTRKMSIDSVVQLMRMGVADVIEVPAPARDVVARSLHFLEDEESEQTPAEITGDSPAMHHLRESALSVAKADSTVLLTGETGTGKGLVARAIHRLSLRGEGPFVHVDCTALSPSIIESELFGHERGSFTGASERRIGRFELAAAGTIFLDEIGDMQPSLQSKLLRVLQEHEYERVGGTRTLAMRARVIAATNGNLRSAMETGQFRSDLFYRLAVFHLQVPPLRDHPEDLPALAERGLKLLSKSFGGPVPRLSSDFTGRLAQHDWPGNVRELMNVLERLFVQRRCQHCKSAAHCTEPVGCENENLLDAASLDEILGNGARAPSVAPPPPLRPARAVGDALAHLDPMGQRDVITTALAETGGNVARAARRLEVPRSTLRYWIKLHKLSDRIPHD